MGYLAFTIGRTPKRFAGGVPRAPLTDRGVTGCSASSWFMTESPAIGGLSRMNYCGPTPFTYRESTHNWPLIKVVGHVFFENFFANVCVYFKKLYSVPKGVIPKYFNLILDILCVISIYT